eukprot:269870-Prorocentrum_minimum.AAC.1
MKACLCEQVLINLASQPRYQLPPNHQGVVWVLLWPVRPPLRPLRLIPQRRLRQVPQTSVGEFPTYVGEFPTSVGEFPTCA